MNHQTAERPKVLVLGDLVRHVLPIVRSLGRQGIRVHVGWCEPDAPVLGSRYLARSEPLAGYRGDRLDWLDDLRSLVAREDFALIIPATEAAVFALQTRRGELEHLAPFYMLDQDVFETVFDKARTYELARSVGVRVPASETVPSVERLDALAGSFPLPAVVKPCFPVREQDVLTKNYVRTVCDRSELQVYARRLLERGVPVILQECVPGRGVGVEVLADDGRVLFAFQHVRLHETSGYGSTYRMSAALDPDLLDAAQRLIGALGYTGVAMVEFRVDPATGRWALLEINGRFWGSLPLSVAAGADFPWYLYQLLVHGRGRFPQEYRVGVRSRDFTLNARWLWRTIRRKQPELCPRDETALAWSINRVPLWRAGVHALRGLVGLDHIDMFARDDPWPFWGELKALARAAVRQPAASRETIPGEARSGVAQG